MGVDRTVIDLDLKCPCPVPCAVRDRPIPCYAHLRSSSWALAIHRRADALIRYHGS